MKLVIIGGASAYTPDIVMGLLRDRQLYAGGELVLQDIDAKNVDLIARLIQGLIRSEGVDLKVTATTDRAEAISGADFILTQPRVGGLKHRALDERIPLEHGVIGQETLGPGGMAFAWRTIPVMLDILADVARLAPKAWVINYANPAGMVTEAVLRRFPDARFIGLCDMPTGVQWGIGKLLRVDYHRISLDYAGLNHAGWCRRVYLDGEDIMPRLRRWLRVLGPVAGVLPLNEASGTLRLAKDYEMIPDPYLRYYYYTEAILKKLQRGRQTRAEVLMKRVPQLIQHYEAVATQEKPVLTQHRGHQSHGDLASMVIGAIAGGRRTRFVIQQRNGGAVPDLPEGQAAQFPAWVDGNGFTRVQLEPLSARVSPLLQRIKAAESENVTAVLEGDRGAAVRAFTENPLVPSHTVAERLVDALVKAHAPYVPQFQ